MKKNIYEFFSWMPFYFLLAPTLMVMVSWNALPGEMLYSVKLLLEDIAIVFTSPSDSAKGTLSVKYTERRFSEATTLLATKNSVQGFEYLDKQLATTNAVIHHAKDTKTKSDLAQTYLVTLHAMNAQLEEQKQTVSFSYSSPAPTPSVKQGTSVNTQPTRKPTGTVSNVSNPTTPGFPTASGDSPTSAEIIDEIAETQETIQEAIDEMETVIEANPTQLEAMPLGVPAGQAIQQGDGGKGEKKGDDRSEKKNSYPAGQRTNFAPTLPVTQPPTSAPTATALPTLSPTPQSTESSPTPTTEEHPPEPSGSP